MDSLSAYVNSQSTLCAQDERELLERYAAGDKSVKEQIINGNIRYVAGIARQQSRMKQLSFDDLLQQGVVGMLRALDRFDPEQNVRFLTYAKMWVVDEIKQFVLKNTRTVPVFHTGEKHKKLYPLLIDAVQETGRLSHEKAEEIAKECGVSTNYVYQHEAGMLHYDTGYFEISRVDDVLYNENVIYGLLSDEDSPEESLENFDEDVLNKTFLKRSLASLNDRNRDIIKSRFLNDKTATLLELSERHGVSQERIRQLEAQSLKKMREVAL
jgi:RNA polymerase sigma-32 factor